MGFINIDGIVQASTDDVHEAVLFSDLLPSPTGEPMKFIDISDVVYGKDGKVRGVLAAHLSWSWANEINKSFMKPLLDRKDLEMFIVSDKDNTILLGPDNLVGKSFNLKSITMSEKDKMGWVVEDWLDGKEYLIEI